MSSTSGSYARARARPLIASCGAVVVTSRAMTTTPTTHPPTTTSGTRQLASGDEFDYSRSRVFALLVELATPHVTHYLSDLYHDASWVAAIDVEPSGYEFTYAIREYGTHVYDHRDESWEFATVDYWRRHSDCVAVYRVHVWRERFTWYVEWHAVYVR